MQPSCCIRQMFACPWRLGYVAPMQSYPGQKQMHTGDSQALCPEGATPPASKLLLQKTEGRNKDCASTLYTYRTSVAPKIRTRSRQ